MKKKILAGIIIILFLTAAGGYCWYWHLLNHPSVIAEPQELKSFQDAKSIPVNNGKVWKNILVVGTDNGENEVSRSDSIMLVSANIATHQVSIISIPRDTRVALEGIGLTKINHANAVGVLAGGVHQGTLDTAKAVSNLLGVPINYYVKIDFQGFVKAVDLVGGIDITLPYPINDSFSFAHFPAGENHLSGEDALTLARTRYSMPNGDFDRQRLQYMLLTTLVNQILKPSNIDKLPEEWKIISRYLDTNLTTSEALSLGLAFQGINRDTIQYYQLPGQGITAQDPLVGAKVYYFEPDTEGVKKVVQEALATK